MTVEADLSVKIALVGDPTVGKSCLLQSELSKESHSSDKKSSGIVVEEKMYNITSRSVQVHYFDIPGSDRFLKLAHRYCSVASAILFVYDASNQVTFDHIEDWLNQVKAKANVALYLVSNKIDLSSTQAISEEEAESFAEMNGMSFLQVDPRSDDDVRKHFLEIISSLCSRVEEVPEPTSLLDSNIKISRSLTTSPSAISTAYNIRS